MNAAHRVAGIRAAEAGLMAELPAGALMQRAATGLAVACADLLGRVYGSRVVVLAGTGNNGADALWAGALLAARGARVVAVLAGEPGEEGAPALAAALAAGARTGDESDLAGADLVVDGLVGIGGRGGLRPPAAALAAAANALGGATVRVAVDVPSGVDADTGAVVGAAVRAHTTVTFGSGKPGLLVGAGRDHAGRVLLVDIGLGPFLAAPAVEELAAGDVARLLPRAGSDADKYRRGVVGVVAGSEQYTGAAVLCVGAALHAGAGMVRFSGSPHAAEQVRAHWPEAVVTTARGAATATAGRVQAWVVGPGLGTDDEAAAAVEAVLDSDLPVLVDADALTVLAAHPEWARRRTAATVLTPHDREYARFGTEVGEDRLAAAGRLAADLGVVVLLKGPATVVADPAGRLRVNPTGTAALATAGTGDVLSGGCGALLAQGADPFDAASVAAWLHGEAGRLAAGGATATAGGVLAAWPAAVAGCGAPGTVAR